jgi:hypothetical protein
MSFVALAGKPYDDLDQEHELYSFTDGEPILAA